MALQTTGPISVSDILAETGIAAGTTVSLKQLETGVFFAINTASPSYPDGSAPDALSEWYGYDHSATAGFINTQYLDYDGVNDYVQGAVTDKTGFSDPNQFTYVLWVRNDNATKRNFHLAHHTMELNWRGNGFLWQYAKSLNRFYCYFYDGGGTRQMRREYPLHDNSSITGITNSSTGWVAGQRGNVDSDGFCMLTLVVDLTTSTATSAVKMYWNGSELTSSVSNTNFAHTDQIMNNFFGIGEWTGNTSPSGGSAGGGIDQFKAYSRCLSAAEIATLYSAGKTDAATAGVTSDLVTEMLFEGDVSDTAGKFSLTNNGGTFKLY